MDFLGEPSLGERMTLANGIHPPITMNQLIHHIISRLFWDLRLRDLDGKLSLQFLSLLIAFLDMILASKQIDWFPDSTYKKRILSSDSNEVNRILFNSIS